MRRQHRKKNWGLPALLILVIIILVGGLFLIFRGAKVQGPNDTNSAVSTSVIDTTPQMDTGIYATSTTQNGETVKILLQFKSKHRFARQIVTTGNTVVMLVDSGTYTKSGKQLTLSSTSAVRCDYASTADYNDALPEKMSRYGQGHKAYPQTLNDTLNNQVRLTAKHPSSYDYLGQWLKLKTATDTVDSVSATAAAQDTSAETESSTPASSTPSTDYNSSVSADSSSEAAASSSASSQSSAAASSSSAALTLDQAQALVAQRYPSDQYAIAASGDSNGVYTFTVTNLQTNEQQTVTVSASTTQQ
ncbi:hypothetical protein ACFQ5J_01410 [Lacticaseibacillus baoqingensis]|uniref:DUF4352 domain-containing protein n=1 Tax=Lacticaseibacillus baoqingensis TaxID=2486013 RepID=A0ABW4E5Z5_9LACO|nr:hypothetical protein [Lacticaseibacillus baoqingensis]